MINCNQNDCKHYKAGFCLKNGDINIDKRICTSYEKNYSSDLEQYKSQSKIIIADIFSNYS